MRLLLDTQAFLWFINDSLQLSRYSRALLEDDNELLLSVASLWEVAIKASLGKLAIALPYDVFITQQPYPALHLLKQSFLAVIVQTRLTSSPLVGED